MPLISKDDLETDFLDIERALFQMKDDDLVCPNCLTIFHEKQNPEVCHCDNWS